jgi:transcription initiation factor IIE alpha subunit
MQIECPQCHHLFRVVLEKKELLDDEEAEDYVENKKEKAESFLEFITPVGTRPYYPGSLGRDVNVDEKTYEYTFKCKHCGNEWSEFKTKEEIGKD